MAETENTARIRTLFVDGPQITVKRKVVRHTIQHDKQMKGPVETSIVLFFGCHGQLPCASCSQWGAREAQTPLRSIGYIGSPMPEGISNRPSKRGLSLR